MDVKVLIYQSQGTDDMRIACRTVEEAVKVFRADAEAIFGEMSGETGYDISLSLSAMTEEQLANVKEE